MSWLDATPVSVIINKFTTDQDILDNLLAYNLLEGGHWALAVLSTVVFCAVKLVWLLLAVIPLLALFWFVLVCFLKGWEFLGIFRNSPEFSELFREIA
jgi:hypothetical protein